ncbi:MAG: protein adenylyltransferase SelO family protein, partial [Thiovulaceae bacterium]|nr:protein adenylyltransferase SelO family protein [Sulfurimonadaceae bacterium]
ALPDSLNDWLDAYEQRTEKQEIPTTKRLEKMRRVNPKYVLKNHILQEAIDKAEQGDTSLVNELLTLALNPFDEHEAFDHYAQPTPKKFTNLKLSCSS